MSSLISPYPGGKGQDSRNASRYFRSFGRYRASLVCDQPGFYDCLFDGFFGGGGITFGHPHGCRNAIAADVDLGVQAVAVCWQSKYTRLLVEHWLKEWKMKVLQDSTNAFAHLKCFSDTNYQGLSIYQTAAAYLTLKRLVFGGVLRCNKNGELNVALSADKLNKFLNAGKRHKQQCDFTQSLFPHHVVNSFWGWQYEWPDNGIQSLTFKHSWENAVQALADSNYENALVVIDAPYWTPNKKMTEAYSHHGDPTSNEVMSLTIDCLGQLLELPNKIGRVVVFNYYSDYLNAEIESLSTFNNCKDKLFCSNLGPLNAMNNGQGIGCHEYHSEAVWEIGGRRMFRDVDSVKQISLLELS